MQNGFGEFEVVDFNWTLTMEQLLIFALVLEKWIAPRGSKSLDELSQLLLVYIGSGVDIVELFSLFELPIVRNSLTENIQSRLLMNLNLTFMRSLILNLILSVSALGNKSMIKLYLYPTSFIVYIPSVSG